MNVLAIFHNDPWKFTDVRAPTVIFCLRSCKMRKKFTKIFCRLWKNREFILINIFSPTFVPNLVTLAWKMSPGMPKEAGLLNGPFCAYLIRQNLHNRTRPRSQGYECPCHISKWSVKIYGRESTNGDFPCAKLENAKKFGKFFFLVIMKKKTELILINMFSSTFVPNLVTLAWKMSSGMPKEAGSLNGPLCAYLMR